MTALQFIFIFVAAITLISAILVVSIRKILHAALWLIVTLMGVAILYVLLEASFYAAVQILVYIGAIAIIIIFAIMLTRNIMGDEEKQANRGWGLVLISVMVFAVILISVIFSNPMINESLVELNTAGQENLIALGEGLLNPAGYALPFELASLLLLGALIGGVYIGMDLKGKETS